MFRWFRWTALLLSGLTAAPVLGATVLQCVPYARVVSGVDLYGDALHWWDMAEDRYKRGHKPKKGAVLAFRPTGPMTLGHVAVVSKVLDDRRILIRHANWSVPGSIEEDVLALDVSDEGDWSAVRIWFSPNGQMGARTNPTYGFIYPAKAKLHDFTPDATLGASTRIAAMAPDSWKDIDPPVRKATLRNAPEPIYQRGPAFAQARTVTAQPARGQAYATPARVAAADPFIVEYANGAPRENRPLDAIIADVKRDAALR